MTGGRMQPSRQGTVPVHKLLRIGYKASNRLAFRMLSHPHLCANQANPRNGAGGLRGYVCVIDIADLFARDSR